MSGLIKAQFAELESRSLGAMVGAEPSPADPADALLERIDLLAAELAEAQSALPGRLAKAREEGHEAGLNERDEAAAERLALLEAGLADALAQWTSRLEQLNGLAVQVAKTVLGRMIGNADWHKDFMSQAIADRLARLDAASVVAVRVSATDFSRDEIAALCADRVLAIEVSSELKSGSCRVALSMGELELGPDAQWSHAAQLLDELTEASC